MQPSIVSTISGDRLQVAAGGSWTTANADSLELLVDGIPAATRGPKRLTLDAQGLSELDTLGAWLIERMLRAYRRAGGEAELVGLSANFRRLFDEVRQTSPDAVPSIETGGSPLTLAVVQLGRAIADSGSGLLRIIEMFGALAIALAHVTTRPRTFRFTSAVHHLDRVGWQAIPIVLLITFLIGGIIAQQGIFQLRAFGASDYAIDLLGILVLREIGVLIVAIMVAGRSGSSYTAELGSMKMREEIDALRAISLDPTEVLMLPRVVAIILALPILAFFGAISALAGGGLVSWLYGGISPPVFLSRLNEVVTVTHLEVGMVKAPFMALIIGVVACSEGMQVRGSAESLGLQTTTSVVKSIFLVIVVDGLFAIFFSSIGM
jgi:phospholipid/cholesterol/gamma-HCH transport system permease protein